MSAAPKITDVPLKTELPALLLPVRLETRRVANALRIRVFPDQPSIDLHQPALSRAEYEAASMLVELVRTKEIGEPALAQWRELARRYGSNRAAWILEERLRGAPEPETDVPPPHTAGLFLLPDRFIFFLYRDKTLEYEVAGNDISSDLKVVRTPTKDAVEISAPSTADGLFDPRSRWIANFDVAVERGLAVEIPLRAEHVRESGLRFSRIVVVGLRTPRASEGSAVAQLIRHHRHARGVEFLRYGTPTNNTLGESSGHSDSEDELLASFEYAVLGRVLGLRPQLRRTTAYTQVSRALGLSPGTDVEAAQEPWSTARSTDAQLLAHVEGAHLNHDGPTPQLIEALWPSTANYFFGEMLGFRANPASTQLAMHASRFLRPRGPLAAIRIGNQPYGILPATRTWSAADVTDGWVPSELDHLDITRGEGSQTFDAEFHRALSALLHRWVDRAADPSAVPRLRGGGDRDEELVQLLGMQPHSVEYRARPIVDQTLVGVLMLLVGGQLFGADSNFEELANSELAMQAWSRERVKLSGDTLTLLSDMGARQAQGSQLWRAFAWGQGGPLNMPLVRDPANPVDGPEKYLPHLKEKRGNADPACSNTLLYDLVRRTYQLIGDTQFPDRWPFRHRIPFEEFSWVPDPVVDWFNGQVTQASLVALALRAPRAEPFPDESMLGKILGKLAIPPWPWETRAPFETFDEIAAAFVDYPELRKNLVDKLRRDFDVLLEESLRDVIDALTCRLDAWFTSLATMRLEGMRSRRPEGTHLGAYGYVEDVDVSQPATTVSGSDGGFIHAPSVAHASAAAILRNAYQDHRLNQDNAYALDLSSARTDRALALLDGVQQGQDLSVLLGYQFERRAHEQGLDRVIDDLRAAFPIAQPFEQEPQGSTEALAARNVCDGRALCAAARPENAVIKDVLASLGNDDEKLREILRELTDAVDAIGDSLMFEGVYQAVQGNFERSGAALDACAGIGRPPELESMKTPSGGITLRHRVCLLLSADLPKKIPANARARAEPRLNAWLDEVFGAFKTIGCYAREKKANGTCGQNEPFTLADLSPAISSLDFLHMCTAVATGRGNSEIEQRLRRQMRAKRPVAPDSTIELLLGESPTARTVADAMELGRYVRDMLGNVSPLTPLGLMHPDDAPDRTIYSELEFAQILARAKSAAERLGEQREGLESTDVEKIQRSLDVCAGYGIEEALPGAGSKAPLTQRAKRSLATLIKREAAAKSLLATAASEVPGVTFDERIEMLYAAFKALFGEDFVMVPAFEMPTLAPGHMISLDGSTMARPPAEERIWLWLQQVAETHPRVRRFESCLLTAQAWRDTSAGPLPGLAVGQLSPRALRAQTDYGWQALADSELGKPTLRTSGAQSVVAMSFGAAHASRFAGFTVDEWTETMAVDRVTTGISFEHDQPASQAPQCLLLAVPGKIELAQVPENREVADWSARQLCGIVSDTMELAKARLVDLDARPEVAGIFPSLMFPIA